MAASSRTLLIASAAFASGIAGTIAFTMPRPGEPVARTRAEFSPARDWAEPVRSVAKPDAKPDAAPAEAPPERLAFHKGEPAAPPPRVQAETDDAPRTPTARDTGRTAAPKEAPAGRANSGPVRQARRPMPPREHVAEARRPEPPPVLARSRPSEAPAGEPRRRFSSAEGGVMKWLAEPGGRY